MKAMLALLISFVLSYPTALAGDAPLRTAETDALATLDVDPVLTILPIQKGEPSPVDGRVMDTPTYIHLAQRTAAAEAEAESLRTTPWTATEWPRWGLLAIAMLSIGFGMGWSLHAGLKAK